MKKYSLSPLWLLLSSGLSLQSAEVLHYVLAPGSIITPYFGATPIGPTEPLTGSLYWVRHFDPIPDNILGFDAVSLNFRSASYSFQLNRTAWNDVMSSVDTDSNQSFFEEVVDIQGLSLTAGYLNSETWGTYYGPPTRPVALYYPQMDINPLGGGFIAARVSLVAVMEGMINVAPSFTRGPDLTVLQNCGAQTVLGWATQISPGPPNEAGQSLAFGATNDNAALFSVPPAIAPDGTLTFTPAADRNGVAEITVVLRDNGGTAYGGQDTSAPQSFTITVLSPFEATQHLLEAVLQADLGLFNKRPLVASLQQASASFENGQWQSGRHHLEIFQKKVRPQLMPICPVLAQQWIAQAQDIIEIFAPPGVLGLPRQQVLPVPEF